MLGGSAKARSPRLLEGSFGGTEERRLRNDFNLVHLSTADLMRQEVAAKTYLGTEIYKSMQQGTPVQDNIILQLLKKTMIKHQDTNRFLLEGFPKSIDQAKRRVFEIDESILEHDLNQV